jgi:AsmA protein
MGKLIKGLFWVVGLLVAIAVVLPLVVDPNDYKEEITKAVKGSTGRELTIDGDLKLSLFPWIGVEMGKTSLSNAAGFGDKPFAAIDEVNVKVKLLPLLSKKVEVSTVVLKGLDLNLAKNSKGVTNWDDLAKSKDSETSKSIDQKEEAPDDSGAALAALAIGGVSIEQANLVWDDRSSGERYEINDFNIKTGKLAIGQPVDFQMDFGLDSAKPKTVAKIDIAAKIIVDSSLQKVTVNDLKLITDAKGETLPNGAVNLTLLASIVADTAAQKLDVKALKIHFDETTITGQAAVNNFEKPAITFGLAVDRINVDKYLPPAEDDEVQKVAATPATAAAAGGSAVPMQTLRDLNVDGKITIGELLASGLTVGDVALDVKAKNGLITTSQTVGKLYQGSYQGETKLDARGSRLKVALNEHLKNVQIGGLLKDMSGKESVSGAANIDASLTAVGAEADSIKKTLNGTLDFAVLDGAVHGLNVMQSIKEAQAALKGKSVAASQDGNKTVFSRLSGSAKVTNGVLKNNDFLLDSSLMQAKGKGTANLVSEELDYAVKVDRVSSGSGELAGKPIALKVSGTFSKPSVNVDLAAMAMEKSVGKINKKAGKVFEKLDKKLPGASDLLKGFLN